jgi:hypothetical protein
LEAEIGRIVAQSQAEQIARETLISKVATAKWTGGVVQATQFHEKKKVLTCALKQLYYNCPN